jgi:hypothetical protein
MHRTEEQQAAALESLTQSLLDAIGPNAEPPNPYAAQARQGLVRQKEGAGRYGFHNTNTTTETSTNEHQHH